MPANTSPRFSFVVPVFNVAPYLQECLQSLAAQTLDDIEIIVVDDGSTDESGAVAKAMAARDPRIRVYRQPNAGPSAARNRGLRECLGEFVSFVDGDDWVDADLARVTAESLDALQSDLGIFRHRLWDVAAQEWRPSFDAWYWDNRIGREPQRISLETWLLLHGLSVKVYRRRVLLQSGVLFPEGLYYEDALQHFALAKMTQTPVAIPRQFYSYRIGRPGQTALDGSAKVFDIFPILAFMWKETAAMPDDAVVPFMVFAARAGHFLAGKLPEEKRREFVGRWLDFVFAPERQGVLRPAWRRLPSAKIPPGDMLRALLLFSSRPMFGQVVLHRRPGLGAIPALVRIPFQLGVAGTLALAAAIWRGRGEIMAAWRGRKG